MMATIKKINKIFIIVIIILFPFAKSYANPVPITVDWYYGDEKWDEAPHRTDVKIEPLNEAPLPDDVDEFYGNGDLKFDFAPEFTGPGRYEYLIYQNNEDVKEEHRSVIYDKTKYHLVYIVDQGKNGLNISVYAYDNDKNIIDPDHTSKVAEIIFKNNDPGKDKTNEAGKDDKDSKSGNDGKNPDSGKKPDNKPENNPNKDKPTIPGKQNPTNPTAKPGKQGFSKNKNSNGNVKTGIEGTTPYLMILLLAGFFLLASKKTN